MRHFFIIGLVVFSLLLAACGEPAATVPATSTEGAVEAPISTVIPTVPIQATTFTTVPTITSAPAREAAATTDTGGERELVVFAVAPFTEALEVIGSDFHARHQDITVKFNFAGGPQLSQQVNEGATVDVIAFHDALLPMLVQTGRVISGTERTIARSRPVIVVPIGNPGQLTTLQDLAKPGLKVVLGSKETAIGQHALAFLNRAAQDSHLGPTYKDAVLANVVSYEASVRAVLAKVIVGEADAAIVYASDAAGKEADKVQQIPIPDNLLTMADFKIAPIEDSEWAAQAREFVDYALSTDAQTVLANYGFIPTTGNATGGPPVKGPLDISGLVAMPITLTVDDLRLKEQTMITATDRDGITRTYQGVLITTLLDQARMSAQATQVVFTGGDGYSQVVPLEALNADPQALVAILEDGSLRTILPTLRPRFWVKGLIQMDVQ